MCTEPAPRPPSRLAWCAWGRRTWRPCLVQWWRARQTRPWKIPCRTQRCVRASVPAASVPAVERASLCEMIGTWLSSLGFAHSHLTSTSSCVLRSLVRVSQSPFVCLARARVALVTLFAQRIRRRARRWSGSRRSFASPFRRSPPSSPAASTPYSHGERALSLSRHPTRGLDHHQT